MSPLLRPSQTKTVKHVSWGNEWALEKQQTETRSLDRKEWKKQQKKKKKKRRLANVTSRSTEDEDDYERMQQKWMFDVLMEPRLDDIIINACESSLYISAMFSVILVAYGLRTDRSLQESLAELRETMNWEIVNDNEDLKEALFAFWRMRAMREQFVQPGQHLSSTDSSETQRGQPAIRRLQNPEPLQTISDMQGTIQGLFQTFIVPFKTTNPRVAQMFEDSLFPSPVDGAPPEQPSLQNGALSSESDSSSATLHSNSRNEKNCRKQEDEDSTESGGEGGKTAGEHGANGADEGEDSRSAKRLKSAAAEQK